MIGRYTHLGLFKRPGKKEKELAFKALEKMKMVDFSDRQISELSGGQQQRGARRGRLVLADVRAAPSAEPAVGLSREPVDLEDAGDPADPAASVGSAGSVGVEECSAWCLDGFDGRDWLTPVTLVVCPAPRPGIFCAG